MSKIIDNPFPAKYPAIMVVITAKKKGNKWYLTGKLKNTSGKTLTGYQPCTRTAKTADDLIICKEIVFTLRASFRVRSSRLRIRMRIIRCPLVLRVRRSRWRLKR